MTTARSISPPRDYVVNTDLEDRVLERISITRIEERNRMRNREKKIAEVEWNYIVDQSEGLFKLEEKVEEQSEKPSSLSTEKKFNNIRQEECYNQLLLLGNSPRISEFLTECTNGDLEKSKTFLEFHNQCVENLGYPEREVKGAMFLHGNDLNKVIDFIETNRKI